MSHNRFVENTTWRIFMFKQLATNLARTVLAVALLLGLLGLGQAVLAGNIDGTDKYAWSTNAGWINFAPATAA